ncbi:hypothetical protein K470DRAFT_209629 [Piedraia hortae CBS 480.64]|uniref:Prion-inhibition and propagation HeLo domain-containing protein n=1 Tax=Piedraia hortae CBS 480.64 TaxID=1314780 RepID=A0A6A7C975_9PEZI|nr:hypothetical protein K470DRAFT_209629 [Piedraia hortae CBS 480.64]
MDKDGSQHVEVHEAPLAGALALATMFSQCVEAFGLVHTGSSAHEERLLLVKLGLQQARLLIWGDIVGVTSPPSTVTNRVVPRHPSATYPDINEPTFFVRRDPRLDDPDVRQKIEATLGSIFDRTLGSGQTRNEMMSLYGLRAPKKPDIFREPAVDTNRLEAFRERFGLLQQVAEEYAHLGPPRNNSLMMNSWIIANTARFDKFISLIRDAVDSLVDLMGVKEAVDRATRMDIRALGWHVAPDWYRMDADRKKLELLKEVAAVDHPEHLDAVNAAAEQLQAYHVEHFKGGSGSSKSQKATSSHASGSNSSGKKGFLGLWKKKPSTNNVNEELEPQRSKSDAGLQHPGSQDMSVLEPIRSKSLGDILHPDPDEAREQPQGPKWEALPSGIIVRHDQYKGLARTDTKDLVQ